MNRSSPEMTNVHCHLCGATLRRPEQFHEVVRPDRNDIIYLCRDETRCATRATFDPPSRDRLSAHAGGLSTRPPAADTARVPAASLEPAGERLTLAETGPIRVHQEHGSWQVHYGSYAQGYHRNRAAAIEKATTDAARENRDLTIEDVEEKRLA